MEIEGLSPKQKALRVNVDPTIYGTFAEIGAGQEVARHFFKAGAASGTIAKSMSAYDMTFSDSIYGREDSGRYVCQSRLLKMLDHEYGLLIERLQNTRSQESRYFAFANTVATSGENNTNAHGWIGIRFQHEVQAHPSEIVVHIRMLDSINFFQQDALGVFGVNLVYAAYFLHESPLKLLNGLMDHIGGERIELEAISCKGPAFLGVDNRLLNLELVKRNYTRAAFFGPNGQVVLASDRLYKKSVQLVRGSFRPPTLVNEDIIRSGRRAICESEGIPEDQVTTVAEITMNNLKVVGLDSSDFLGRVSLINSLGYSVLISNFPQYYKLVEYFKSMRVADIALILGGYNFKQIFDPSYYDEGTGLFTALGQLFQGNVNVYVYPYKDEREGQSVTLDNLEVPDDVKLIYQQLKQNRKLKSIDKYDDSILHIYSRKVLKLIESGDSEWEAMVPEPVRDIIKHQHLYGYKD